MTASLDNIQFMNSNLKPEDLDGDMPIKPAEKSKKSNDVLLNINTQDGASNIPNLSSTLDEPVSVTIMRDVKAVAYKFGHVFIPKRSALLLKDWVIFNYFFSNHLFRRSN
jgi:hypothetical protein